MFPWKSQKLVEHRGGQLGQIFLGPDPTAMPGQDQANAVIPVQIEFLLNPTSIPTKPSWQLSRCKTDRDIMHAQSTCQTES